MQIPTHLCNLELVRDQLQFPLEVVKKDMLLVLCLLDQIRRKSQDVNRKTIAKIGQDHNRQQE